MSDMKLIMESWRKFSLNEEGDRDADGISYEKEVEALKRVYKIVRELWTENDVWQEDLLTLLEDRINRVAAGYLEKPPNRTRLSFLRMARRIGKGFKRALGAAASAGVAATGALAAQVADLDLEESNIPEDEDGGKLRRAKRRLVLSLNRALQEHEAPVEFGTPKPAPPEKVARFAKAIEDLDNMDTFEDIENESEHLERTAWSDWMRRDVKNAFETFRNQFKEAEDEDLAGTMSQQFRRAINILRSPVLEKVYLKDLQELLFDLYMASLTDNDELWNANFE